MGNYFSDKIDEIGLYLDRLRITVSRDGMHKEDVFETLNYIRAGLEELEDHSRNISSIIENAPLAIAIIDNDGKFCWIKDRSDAKAGAKRSRTFSITCKDGSEKTVKFAAVQQEDGTNQLVCEEVKKNSYGYGYASSSDDRPQLTRRQLMDIIDFLPDATFVIDHNKRVIAWNRAIEEMTGIKKQDMIGKGDYAYSIPFYGKPRPILVDLIYDDSSSVRSQYRYVERKGDTFYAESASAFMLAGQKAYIWATASPLRDEEGAIIGAIESIRDITSRMKAQEELRNSEAKNRSLLDAIPDIMFLVSEEGTFLDCNAAESSSLYLPRHAFLGKKIQDLMPQRMVEQAFLYIGRAKSTGKMQIFEYELPVNGKTCFFEARINPSGEDAFLVLVRDITESKMAQEALCRAKEEAEAAARAKSEFLANMSHEIRTPLNAIIGMTAILHDTPLLDDQRDCLEMVSSSGDMLISLINNILDFSKIEEGKREMERLPFRLKKCIEEAMDLLTPAAAEKYLTFEYKIDERIPENLLGDATSISQVLINLIGNAVKFTDRGSISVGVSVKAREGGGIRLLFEVSDSGIGIPQDHMSSLFQSFSQVDMSTTRKYGGTGLGLAISKKLVNLMGGDIWVKSEIGKGSTFSFTIIVDECLKDESMQGQESSREIPQKAKRTASKSSHLPADICGQLKLLLAEDNLVNQKVALLMLKKLGINADVAVNGKEVLLALEQKRYDVILMDVQMPEMDGFEAARAIRKRRNIGQPHIIAVTAYALEGDRKRCIEAGMDDYISKPVRLEELAGALGRCPLMPQTQS